MTALRSAFDHEANVLLGMTVDDAKAEASRLTAKANELTAYLARPRAGLTSVCRANLERERDVLEWSSAGLEARIAEFQGKIVKVREAGPAPSARAASVRRRKQASA